MSTIVRPPANFWRDLNDTRTRYAEQLVYDYLRGIKRWAVTDTRELYVPWGFCGASPSRYHLAARCQGGQVDG